ncbi:MAG: phytanoyl-CoA dioxygenase family protein [Microthrixaceae bacterium]
MNGGRFRPGIARLLQTSLGARLVLEPVVVSSYRQYLRTGRTPALGYSAMRKLFGTPRGERLDDLARRSLGEHAPLHLADRSGIIRDDASVVIDDLRRDGIALLASRLPQEDCAALIGGAQEAMCTVTERAPGAPHEARFDPVAPVGVRHDVPEDAVLALPAAQRLVADRSVLAIAQEYLGGAPVQDLLAMWWTAASPSSSSAAAQEFHFDLDRLRFLKLFVYLTDVGPESGPHVYVRGSHRSLPPALRADRRFSDDEVLEHFTPDDVLSITGEQGSMFLADTRGLHKGVHVNVGHRLVLQLEYASSLFGASVPRAEVHEPVAELEAAVADFPATYRRFELT